MAGVSRSRCGCSDPGEWGAATYFGGAWSRLRQVGCVRRLEGGQDMSGTYSTVGSVSPPFILSSPAPSAPGPPAASARS